jgi:hypothetical protein
MSKCRHDVRVKVELCLDIPRKLIRKLNKKTLRSKDVQIDGAFWQKMTLYCRRCGVSDRAFGATSK